MAPKIVSKNVIYSKPGTQPPIYLAGSFSEPQWQPQEMKYTTDENNEHDFYYEVQIEQGKEYQYKFRIGEGEWWTLNEDSPTVTDDIGNRNNLLAVPITEEHTAPIESKPATNGHPQEEAPVSAADMDHKEDHAEETMGTRETSDVLFDDEIIKDNGEMSMIPTSEPVEPHPTPAMELEGTKAEISEQSTKTNTALNVADPTKYTEPITTPAIILTAEKIHSSTPAVTEKSQLEHVEEETKERAEPAHVQSPIVVVEKVDSEPSHGDDFGPEATVGQKDAHNLRAQDAEPDHTIIRPDTRTPELAEVAAEVADSAAVLDRDASTPPVSDEEAGRIGYRRMSATPIPEVAAVAAEVADVAATIDKPSLSDLFDTRSYFDIMNDESLEFPETPPHLKAPYFPHEIGGTSNPIVPRRQEPIIHRPSRFQEPIDLNDPSIEMFPTDRAGIMEHLRKMQERLPEDQADCVGGDDSPIVDEFHNSSQRNNKSPAMIAQERSPSLDSITEENDDSQEMLPSAAKSNGISALPRLNEIEEVEEAGLEPAIPITHANGVQPNGAVPLENKNSVQDVEEEPTQKEERNSAPEQTDKIKPEPAANGASSNAFAPSSKHLADTVAVDIPSVTVLEVEAVHPDPLVRSEVDRSLDGADSHGASSPLPLSPPVPTTPFVVGDKQLGHDVGLVQQVTTNGPSIFVEPATPMATRVISDPLDKPLDTGNTTAFEDNNGGTHIKPRKRQPSPVPERPLTPSSMRSAGKDAESQNFLKAFWRVVFVDWIGGLIMRLCGGGRDRRRT